MFIGPWDLVLMASIYLYYNGRMNNNSMSNLVCFRTQFKLVLFLRCVSFLAGTERFESMIYLCFTTPATFIFTKFVPNKLNNYLRYATVALLSQNSTDRWSTALLTIQQTPSPWWRRLLQQHMAMAN